MTTNSKHHDLENIVLESIEPPAHMRKALLSIPHLCSGRLSTAKSIEVFYRIVKEQELDQHSEYRLQFWQQYLSQNQIHQAWIILAPSAIATAKQLFHIKSHQHGTFIKNRKIDENHAVLLMRLGQLVVAEWSHAGKCRFWNQANPNSPAFFKRTYSRDELTDYADYVQQHYFSAKGLWQKDAAHFLEKAGIPMAAPL